MSDEAFAREVQDLRAQVAYQRTVMAQIYELTDPRTLTPLLDVQAIRIKALAAISSVDKSGVLA